MRQVNNEADDHAVFFRRFYSKPVVVRIVIAHDARQRSQASEKKQSIRIPRQGSKEKRRVATKYDSYFELETQSTCVRNMKKEAPSIKGADAE